MPTLDSLPLELLFRILDYLNNPHEPCSDLHHPLNHLSASSKHFDSAVEEYTRALLKQHANFAPKKRSQTYTSRKKWLAETCQLCYKKSKRRSTLWAIMTCCLACDKEHFPKVTMTNAIKQHHLSKLDIFTPSRLHPSLPPLAHGEYPVMGGVATMIYEPDLASRRDYIHRQLEPKDRDVAQLRKRVRRHDTLMAHMEMAYHAGRKTWYRAPRWLAEGEGKTLRASMKTRESRAAFVREGLQYEHKVMGMGGTSEKTAIVLG